MTNKQGKIRVILADSTPIVAGSIAASLARDARISIVGTAENATELINAAAAVQPDVILASVHLDKMDDGECLAAIQRTSAKTRIIVFSIYDLLMTRIVFLEAGADAVIQGNKLPERIAAQIQQFFPKSEPSPEFSEEARGR